MRLFSHLKLGATCVLGLETTGGYWNPEREAQTQHTAQQGESVEIHSWVAGPLTC